MQILYNANIKTMDKGLIINDGYVAIENGKISEVGHMHSCPYDLNSLNQEEAIDLRGQLLFPGFVDAHTHLGMWEDALGFEGDDGNEDTDPSTPHLRAIDAVNPMDKCFDEALAAGVTTVLTGPGSANPVAGQFLAMKTAGKRIDDMIVKEPAAMKFALGENPKTTYHGKSQTPVTRMATAAIIREQLIKARRYMFDLEESRINDEFDEPEYDFKCEALIPILKREVKSHFHAHRADDIFTAIRISKEFNLDYVIVHCTHGHEIAEYLAEEGVCALCGPIICDRSKPELKYLTPKSAGILNSAGVKTAIITDHPVIPVQYLPLSAAIAVRDGMDYDAAMRAITITPAEICGIDDRVGSISVGKDADLLVFKDDPFSSYSRPEMVFSSGNRVI